MGQLKPSYTGLIACEGESECLINNLEGWTRRRSAAPSRYVATSSIFSRRRRNTAESYRVQSTTLQCCRHVALQEMSTKSNAQFVIQRKAQ